METAILRVSTNVPASLTLTAPEVGVLRFEVSAVPQDLRIPHGTYLLGAKAEGFVDFQETFVFAPGSLLPLSIRLKSTTEVRPVLELRGVNSDLLLLTGFGASSFGKLPFGG